jgi:ribosome modulation factor
VSQRQKVVSSDVAAAEARVRGVRKGASGRSQRLCSRVDVAARSFGEDVAK